MMLPSKGKHILINGSASLLTACKKMIKRSFIQKFEQGLRTLQVRSVYKLFYSTLGVIIN